MSNKQYIYIWKKMKEVLHGSPEPKKYMKMIDDIYNTVQAHSTDDHVKQQTTLLLIEFMNILNAHHEEGEEL